MVNHQPAASVAADGPVVNGLEASLAEGLTDDAGNGFPAHATLSIVIGGPGI
jgi:hypothetical protein